jgi:hypothetical protein
VSDFPSIILPPVISSFGRYSPQGAFAATRGLGAASGTFSVANKAYYHPVLLPVGCVATKLWWVNGATVTGNVDVGIYDREGNRLVSSGSTAQSGANTLQTVDVTDTPLSAGWHYLAIACDTATATAATSTALLQHDHQLGMFQQTSAFALPSTATFAAPSTARAFLCGFAIGRLV